MAKDEMKKLKSGKALGKMTGKDKDGDYSWNGMDTNGESKNTFGPKPKSTPNKVGAEEFEPKSGKGKITGGIEQPEIFTEIEYTGNTTDAGKKDFKSVDKKIFDAIKYNYTPEGFPDSEGNDGVFGTAEFGSKMKDKKVNGFDEQDEDGDANRLAKPFNPNGKRTLKPEANFNGSNPTDVNVGKTKSPFRTK
jgi:hypothetical protein